MMHAGYGHTISTDYPMRNCDNPGCGRRFKPKQKFQRRCSFKCQQAMKKRYADAYRACKRKGISK